MVLYILPAGKNCAGINGIKNKADFMDYVCPTCGKKLKRELQVIIPHTEEHIIADIQKKHPRWVDSDGVCRKCYLHYKIQLHPK